MQYVYVVVISTYIVIRAAPVSKTTGWIKQGREFESPAGRNGAE